MSHTENWHKQRAKVKVTGSHNTVSGNVLQLLNGRLIAYDLQI